MADKISSLMRSAVMRRVHSRNTSAELTLRRMLYKAGYRYRINLRDLPGSPDVVFLGRKKAIFVHGCFWHGHQNCRRSLRPVTSKSYWNSKLDRNIERDIHVLTQLTELGWNTMVVWECELKSECLIDKLRDFIGPTTL